MRPPELSSSVWRASRSVGTGSSRAVVRSRLDPEWAQVQAASSRFLTHVPTVVFVTPASAAWTYQPRQDWRDRKTPCPLLVVQVRPVIRDMQVNAAKCHVDPYASRRYAGKFRFEL